MLRYSQKLILGDEKKHKNPSLAVELEQNNY